ncbi:DUF4190 domain-containing protein [Xylanimonas oleitrophica]|uniref:DUF4190 domain-containing protein n=1 Tax=Xylanimonas oleitrophica TaxID=2607479 RepID=A0A2W5XV27_9MICO|nr:DUF4190 domain-containing protein [Xylanimonas oleitrophica]PZR54248.1 DUF4190 domain-containing protein [Xylanimonas oleitrophica]
MSSSDPYNPPPAGGEGRDETSGAGQAGWSQPSPGYQAPQGPSSGSPYPGGGHSPYQGYEQPGSQSSYGQSPYGQSPYGASYGPAAQTDGLAVGALVCGIVGLTVVPVLGSIAAVVLGLMSLSRLRTSGQGGKGLAVAGLVMGGVGVLGALLLVVLVFGLLGLAASAPWGYSMGSFV